MSWFIRLTPVLLFGACGGTALEHGGDGNGGTAGTGGSGGTAGTGSTVTREPTNHRRAAKVCDTPPPTGLSPQGASPPPQQCMTDMDCTASPNGRCTGTSVGLVCFYDQCFGDGDCTEAAVCACGTEGGGNRCLGAGCRVDTDCPGSFCSPTFGSCGTYSGVIAYACHTPKDQCVNDADCTSGGGYCMYDPMVAHWVCSSSQCVG